MFFSVVLPLLPENISVGGSKATIWTQLFGATFGSFVGPTVETSVIGPGIKPGAHSFLSIA